MQLPRKVLALLYIVNGKKYLSYFLVFALILPKLTLGGIKFFCAFRNHTPPPKLRLNKISKLSFLLYP